MTLVLTNDDVAKVLTMSETLLQLELLYADLGRNSAVYRGRTDLFIPTTGAPTDAPSAYQLKTLDGAVPRWNVGSIRVTSDVVSFPLVDGMRRRVKIPAAAGKRWVGLVFLFDSGTGELISILQDGILQRYSVGAINAIGAKFMSRENSETVALFGAGGQSAPQILGLKEVRPIRRVQIFTPNAAEAQSYAKTRADELGVEIVPAASPEQALEDADIIVTATNSRVPFFPASWIKPGVHLSCLQRDEAHPDCYRELDLVVFHTHAKEIEYVSADFVEIEAKYGFTMHDHPPSEINWNDFPDLGDLVSGRTARRTDARQRTFFLNSTGCGAQYSAVAQLIYAAAKSRGLGYELPSDLVSESIAG